MNGIPYDKFSSIIGSIKNDLFMKSKYDILHKIKYHEKTNTPNTICISIQ